MPEFPNHDLCGWYTVRMRSETSNSMTQQVADDLQARVQEQGERIVPG